MNKFFFKFISVLMAICLTFSVCFAEDDDNGGSGEHGGSGHINGGPFPTSNYGESEFWDTLERVETLARAYMAVEGGDWWSAVALVAGQALADYYTYNKTHGTDEDVDLSFDVDQEYTFSGTWYVRNDDTLGYHDYGSPVSSSSGYLRKSSYYSTSEQTYYSNWFDRNYPETTCSWGNIGTFTASLNPGNFTVTSPFGYAAYLTQADPAVIRFSGAEVGETFALTNIYTDNSYLGQNGVGQCFLISGSAGCLVTGQDDGVNPGSIMFETTASSGYIMVYIEHDWDYYCDNTCTLTIHYPHEETQTVNAPVIPDIVAPNRSDFNSEQEYLDAYYAYQDLNIAKDYIESFANGDDLYNAIDRMDNIGILAFPGKMLKDLQEVLTSNYSPYFEFHIRETVIGWKGHNITIPAVDIELDPNDVFGDTNFIYISYILTFFMFYSLALTFYHKFLSSSGGVDFD